MARKNNNHTDLRLFTEYKQINKFSPIRMARNIDRLLCSESKPRIFIVYNVCSFTLSEM
jgi:hypothetical protein